MIVRIIIIEHKYHIYCLLTEPLQTAKNVAALLLKSKQRIQDAATNDSTEVCQFHIN